MPQTVGQYLGQKGPVISQHPVSDNYRSRYAETFGKDADPFCLGCGMRRVWCECGGEMRSLDVALASPPSHHGFIDREGNYHPAPGYNVIGTGL